MQLGALHDLPNGDGGAGCRSDDDLPRQGLVGADSGVDTAKRRSKVVEWLNALFPGLSMAHETSEEDLRARLLDGALLCGILKRFSPSYAGEIISAANRSENVRKFIVAVEQTGLPSFNASDLEQGSMSAVVYCLWSLKEHLVSDNGEIRDMNSPVRIEGRPLERWRSLERRMEALRLDNMPNVQSSAVFGDERKHSAQDARLQRVLRSPVMSESATPATYSSGHKFHEVFQLKQGRYYDIPAAKITELMKSNSLDNAPTQSLLSVMNGILDESIERKNGEIPHRVACLLRKVVQEIERRISTQTEHIRNQNNLIKTREEKYQSRIRVLETLANGTADEIPQVGMNQVQLPKTERLKFEERSKNHEEYVAKLAKGKEKSEQIISELKKELETLKRTEGQSRQMGTKTKEKVRSEQIISELRQEIETLKKTYEEQLHQMENKVKEKDKSGQTISELQQEIETIKKAYEEQFHQGKNKAKEKDQSGQTISELQQEIKTIKKTYEEKLHQMENKAKEKDQSGQIIWELQQEIKTIKKTYEEKLHQMENKAKEKDQSGRTISELQQEIETIKKTYEEQRHQLEKVSKEKEKSKQTISELEQEIETVKRTYEEQFHQTGDKAKEKMKSELTISKLKQEMETIKKAYEEKCRQMELNAKSEQTISELKQEIETIKRTYEEQFHQTGDKAKEKEKSELTISKLNQEIETIKKTYEEQCRQMEENTKEKEKSEKTILELKQEIAAIKNAYEEQCHQMGDNTMVKEKSEQTTLRLNQEIENIKKTYEDQCHLMEKKEKEKEKSERIILELKQEIETIKKAYEEQSHQMGNKIKEKEKSEQTTLKLNQEIETIKRTYEELCHLMEKKEKEKEKSERIILELKQERETIKKAYEEQSNQMGNKIKEKEKSEQTTLKLNQEIETIKKTYEELCHIMEKKEKEKERSESLILELKQEIETIKKAYEEQSYQLGDKIKEKEKSEQTISELNQEIETIKETYEKKCQEMENKAKESLMEIEKKLKDTESFLAVSKRKINELETVSEFKFQIWNKKERIFHSYIDRQVESVQELRSSSDSLKQEVKITETRWCEEVSSFGKKLKVLTDAVENYNSVLAENRKLYNEIQELRGNIRVYCRVRPFLPGENRKQTTVDSVNENGEIIIVNPAKQGKDAPRLFKFNKAFGPTATQEEVYLDTQPLVRSVLDGYNVCIFAYGQTGSGKTYTMTGPDIGTEKEWGVNYRALNDLFNISRQRSDIFTYEVGVQMVEVYNEQIRDLLASGGSQKKLGVLVNAQATGLAVPDASMLPVKSTSNVMDLMQLGHHNRSVSATSQNERSSRSHSIVTIHVRGTDLKNGSTLRGSLHLVDLAGSERVDRSEVIGDRLKEAQHINKSLAALGDVIFALSQKSSHVPYRNSKLTQVLQSSLGGHAKTLMFVQINPEIASFSESLSTLKFAERVSGVELGAAKSHKEGKDIKDLMEQVASLKDTIARKDDEIDQLQQIKGPGNSSLRRSSSSRSVSPGTAHEDGSEYGGDQHSADPELMGSGDENSDERSSDISDDGQSVGTEDGSVGTLVENNANPEQGKSSETTKEKVTRTRVSKPLTQKTPATRTRSREPLKHSTASSPAAPGLKRSTSQSSASSARPPSRGVGKAPGK